MRKYWVLLAASALASCGAPDRAGNPTGAAESADTAAAVAPQGRARQGGPAPVEITLPQLAYAYRLGFRLPGDRIAAVQDAHRDLCDRMGPARCQLLGLNRGGGEDAASAASLKLRVVSGEARRFTDAAAKTVADSGGRTVDTNVAAEDVSKNIVDAEARIRQRELLVERLTAILRTRTGKVSELVEAERSVAQAQEELDQAKGWLAELRGRVAMSDVEIGYTAVAPSASPGTLGGRLGEALAGSGAGFLVGLQLLLTLLIYLAPWALLIVPIVLIANRLGRRRRGEATPPSEA